MNQLTSDWRLPGSHHDPFRSTQDKVDWILNRLEGPAKTSSWNQESARRQSETPITPYPQFASPMGAHYFSEGLSPSATMQRFPQAEKTWPPLQRTRTADPYPQPRSSWETVENILYRLERRPDPAINEADNTELFQLASSRRGGSPSALTPR